MYFCFCDLDLDPVTWDILKMFLHTKSELSRSRLSKVMSIKNRQTDTRTHATENITTPYSLVAKILITSPRSHSETDWPQFETPSLLYDVCVLVVLSVCMKWFNRRRHCWCCQCCVVSSLYFNSLSPSQPLWGSASVSTRRWAGATVTTVKR